MTHPDPTSGAGASVVVWGNCQAPPLAELLRAPLAARGLRVETVPPVYLAGPSDVERVHSLVRRCAALVSQPVADTYRVAGTSTDHLASLLPGGATLVGLPVVYDVGAFPFQVRGYTGGGERVDAPVTDYHDLRVLWAAERGWSAARTVADWPAPSERAVRAVAADSLAELRRREDGLAVAASDLVHGQDALWTMTHPANRLLAELARRVLAVLGVDEPVAAPAREFLGQRRAPVDDTTARVLGWAPTQRSTWQVDAAAVPTGDVVTAQLAFYARRPDVVRATLGRAAARTALLRD